jgi:uncharacterized protein YfbU (UPF0304 family)
MELTVFERKVLYNQLELLKESPDADVKWLEKCQLILENGYRSLYGRLFEHLNTDELSEEQATFVYDVLTMFEAFQRFEEQTGEKAGGLLPSFSGFDGNDESKFLGFVRFLVQKDERWDYLGIKNFNSHFPMVATYRRMLAVWLKLPMPERVTSLTRAQVDAIQAEAIHPENRK